MTVYRDQVDWVGSLICTDAYKFVVRLWRAGLDQGSSLSDLSAEVAEAIGVRFDENNRQTEKDREIWPRAENLSQLYSLAMLQMKEEALDLDLAAVLLEDLEYDAAVCLTDWPRCRSEADEHSCRIGLYLDLVKALEAQSVLDLPAEAFDPQAILYG